MKHQPITDLERFDLLQALFPEEFTEESDIGDEEAVIEEKFGVDPEEFDLIAGHLVMCAPIMTSPLSETRHHVLGDINVVEGKLYVMAAVKREVQ